jgi:hypothetical protein
MAILLAGDLCAEIHLDWRFLVARLVSGFSIMQLPRINGYLGTSTISWNVLGGGSAGVMAAMRAREAVVVNFKEFSRI